MLAPLTAAAVLPLAACLGRNVEKTRTRRSYDAIAGRYAEAITPVDRKPFDLAQIGRFLDGLPEGPIWDLGCGPGDAVRAMRMRRVAVMGLDLSPGMIREARARDPEGRYEVGDITALPPRPAPLAGLTAFYCLIHIAPERVAPTLKGWFDALAPGGRLLLAVHEGSAPLHLETMLDSPVDLDFHFFKAEELAGVVAAQGFVMEHLDQREPYPDLEAQTRRIYLTARRP